MSIDPKWWTRERWTLIEAAQICAGVNPYLGKAPTDSPHVVEKRIKDPSRRELFRELYARSKDAVEGGSLEIAERPRTGNWGNVRVRPGEYVWWVTDLPLPQNLGALVPSDQFPNALRDLPSALKLGWQEGGDLGPTLEEAARKLAETANVVESALLEQLWQAVQRGDLELVDPQTSLPMTAPLATRRDWFYRVRISKLNEWLESVGAPYRYPDAAEGRSTSVAADSGVQFAKGVGRKTIIATFKVRRTDDANAKYWDDKLSRPPCWLAGALVAKGKPGKSNRWNPVLVAGALLEQSKSKREGMTLAQLDRCMATLNLTSEWEQATENDRQ